MKIPEALIKVKDGELVEWVDLVTFLLNAGKYSTPIYEGEPDSRSINEGESFIIATGETRKLEVMINGVLCSINFTPTGSVSTANFGNSLGDRILDSDANTAVITEFTANEDMIRMYVAGQFVVAVNTLGMAVSSGYPIRMNGIEGNTYLVNNTSAVYLQHYVDGVLRMEM